MIQNDYAYLFFVYNHARKIFGSHKSCGQCASYLYSYNNTKGKKTFLNKNKTKEKSKQTRVGMKEENEVMYPANKPTCHTYTYKLWVASATISLCNVRMCRLNKD